MTDRFVYFIRPVGMDGPVKIGCSIDPGQRIMPLAQWSPFPLEIAAYAPGTFANERFIHSCFAKSHSHHEWFLPSERLTALIQEVSASGKLDAALSMTPEGSISAPHDARWPASRRLYMSIIQRVGNIARRRLGQGLRTPPDIEAILKAWYRRPEYSTPPADEMLRLETYLADPVANFMSPIDLGAAA